jgi:hypothetical protein
MSKDAVAAARQAIGEVAALLSIGAHRDRFTTGDGHVGCIPAIEAMIYAVHAADPSTHVEEPVEPELTQALASVGMTVTTRRLRSEPEDALWTRLRVYLDTAFTIGLRLRRGEYQDDDSVKLRQITDHLNSHDQTPAAALSIEDRAFALLRKPGMSEKSASVWAAHLGCEAGTVRNTKAWKNRKPTPRPKRHGSAEHLGRNDDELARLMREQEDDDNSDRVFQAV